MKVKTLITPLLFLWVLAGCTERTPHQKPVFKLGEYVIAKVSGDKGMVIYTNCYRSKSPCTYDVRFAVLQSKTNTHLLKKDGQITTVPLARIDYMREYELEKAGVE